MFVIVVCGQEDEDGETRDMRKNHIIYHPLFMCCLAFWTKKRGSGARKRFGRR